MTSTAALPLLASLAVASLAAGAAQPVAGTDYQPVDPPAATSDPSKVVVTQFFSYQCPHCYKFEKPFTAWASGLGADVKVERAAVSIGRANWLPAATAFYALTAMQKSPAIDDAYFGAIHRERKPLADETSIADWVATQGVDRAKFLEAYRSFGVGVKVKRAESLSREVRLPSVPSLVIDGRYLIPIADDGDFSDQLALANALIDRARRERAAASTSSP
jgi:protein dithiol oxidoreductase (disulfide-forming)